MIRPIRLIKKPIKGRFLRALCNLSVCCAVFSVQAQEQLTLNKAISLSLNQHPELKSFIYSKEAALAQVEQAGVKSPMSLNASIEDGFGTGSYAGVNSLQTTLSISWLLEGDIVDARVKLANSKVSTADIEQEVKAIDIASETSRIFITLLAQKEKLLLAKLALKQAQDVLAQIQLKVKAGKLFVVDELRAKAALSLFELEVEDLIHEIEASKSQLAAQWQGNTNFVISGTLSNIPDAKSLEVAVSNLKSNPKLQRYLLDQAVMQSEIDLAVEKQVPAWTVSTGIKRNEVVDDFAIIAGISIPLGGENRNKGRISALKAKQLQSKTESDALYQRISTQALLLTHKLKHNRHVIDSLTNESIPFLEQANVKAGEAYQQGSYRYTDWYAVQQELVEAQTDLIDAYTNIQLFNIELERLTGTSVSK